MAILKGVGGSVTVGSDVVANVDQWTINCANTTLDTTGLGASGKSFIGTGVPEFTADVTYKALDPSDTATAAIMAAILDNSTGIQLKLGDGAGTWDSGAGNFFIDSFSQSASVDGLVTGSFSGKFSGAPSYS